MTVHFGRRRRTASRGRFLARAAKVGALTILLVVCSSLLLLVSSVDLPQQAADSLQGNSNGISNGNSNGSGTGSDASTPSETADVGGVPAPSALEKEGLAQGVPPEEAAEVPQPPNQQVAEHDTGDDGGAGKGRLRSKRRRIDHSQHHHEAIGFIVLASIIASQVGLYRWRQWSPRTYGLVSLAGLVIVPVGMSAMLGFVRFICIWALWMLVTAYYVRLALSVPLAKSTPRAVYRWFHWVHRVSSIAATGGYVLFMLEVMGLALILPPIVGQFSILAMFYGLYFGVLGRDCAEVCAERISITLGYCKKDDDAAARVAPGNICALCGDFLRAAEAGGEATEKLYQLKCSHTFHEYCIRGWVIVGKKDTCPFCADKVPVRALVGTSPWAAQSLVWVRLLDAVRYLLVFYPILMFIMSFVIRHSPLMHEDDLRPQDKGALSDPSPVPP